MSATTNHVDVDAHHAGVPPAPPEAHQRAGTTTAQEEGQERTYATFSLDCRIHDPRALYDAALAHAIDADGINEDDAVSMLMPDGRIDLSACLVMLLDPGSIAGCSVDGSSTALSQY